MFLFYMTNIEKLIQHRRLSQYLHPDVTEMFIYCHPGNKHLLHDTTLFCIFNISAWISSNRMKLNPANTRFLWYTSSQRRKYASNQKCKHSTGNVCMKHRHPYGSQCIVMITHHVWRSDSCRRFCRAPC